MARAATGRRAKRKGNGRARAGDEATRTGSRPSPSMTYFEDRGAVYDAPIETVWDFMQKDEEFHPKAHSATLRNMEQKQLSEVTLLLRYETLDGDRRRWRKYVSRLTEIRPSVRILEQLEGPNAGTKTVHLYIPRGKRTVVDVLCYMCSPERSPAETKREMLRKFSQAYKEDLPYFRRFARKQAAGQGPAS